MLSPTGERIPDEQRNAQIVATLTPVVSALTAVAVAKEPGSAAYLDKVAAVFCQINQTGKFNPDYVLQQLSAIPIGGGSTVQWTTLVKSSLFSLYELNYKESATRAVDPQKVAGVLANVMCNGIKLGLNPTAPK